MIANVKTIEVGKASVGIKGRAQVAQEEKDDQHD
jgi:hypothetical protein